MDRKEVWEATVDAIEHRFLRTEFEEGEFEVLVNRAAGQITVIHRPSREAMSLTDTTFGYYDSQNRIVFPEYSPVTGSPIDHSYRTA